MPHDVALIATIAIGFAFAFIFDSSPTGWASRRWSAIWWQGSVGPTTPGFVADSAMAGQLAEIGGCFSFGVGLHFSIADLIAVPNCVPGAIGQIVIATAIGTVAVAWG